ncbi:MAG: hypothetical protein HZA46_19140 [Planctomycetales bacterium]|nr:hypothetical protein [Planctomycetales bacterium]
MSEAEFEKFLALLSGMLKLDAVQRDEIATELRDHLENRLTELLAEGVPRDKAILIALEEFGDAAGLAAEFLHIVRHQKRRKIMRLTAGSLAAAVAMVLGVMAFWPDSHPLSFPATSRALAQATAAVPATPGEPTVEENNAATERKLAKRIPAQFADTPLKDVLEYVFDSIGVDNVIRMTKLAEEGVGLENPINLNLKQIRAEMLLDLVLNDAGLTYTVRDGIVIISTQADQDVALEVRIYNVRDLVTMDAEKAAILRERWTTTGWISGGGFGGGSGGGGGFFQVATPGAPAVKTNVPSAPGSSVPQPAGSSGGPGGSSTGQVSGTGGNSSRRAPGPVPASDGKLVEYFEPLIDLIRVTVMPETWDEVGGAGSVMQYDDGLLVVNQSPQIHKKISSLLEKLRELRGNHAGPQVPAKVKR